MFFTISLAFGVLQGMSAVIPFKSDPSKDLKIISHSHASVVSKDWLSKCDVIPDYIENSINRLESYISDHRGMMDIYLSWAPENKIGYSKELFIVCCEIKPEQKLMKVNHIVQNPEWDPKTINSIELKKSLDLLNERVEYTTIDYSVIKEYMPRYYMSWFPPKIMEKSD